LLIFATNEIPQLGQLLSYVTLSDIYSSLGHGRQHRIIIDKGCGFAGASFYRTGQSTFAPKGQTSLLPLVPAVAERLSYEQDTNLSDEDLLSLFND
jgi:hypothetical protein